MKLFKIMMLFLAAAFSISSAVGQANASLNLLTLNSGQVVIGQTVFVQVDVGNTGPTSSIGIYKIKAQISIPTTIASVAATGHVLPSGWTITSQSAGVINLSNGTDIIPVNAVRSILIAVVGNAIGGPSTVGGQLSFSNGVSPGTGPGSLSGDNSTDNASQSSLQVINAPACAIGVTASAGNILCNAGTTTLTAVATGTTATVEYSLNGGAFQSSNTFTVNAAGSPYTVTAREVGNTTCNANSSPVTVSQPTAVSATASVTSPIVVSGGTGTITVNATGGTGSKTYAVTSGTTTNTTGATSGVFTGLLAGSYTFTATDANGCMGTASIALNNPAPCNIAVSASAGTILCSAGTTTLTAVATGANGTVEYSLNGGAFQSGNTFTVNAAGSPYIVTAREAGNTTCSASSSPVTVSQPSAVAASASVTTAIAVPGGTGTITVSATGGTGAKTYVITSGTTINTTGASSGVFTGLLAGSYLFTATDANGCSGTATTVLSNPGVATADPAVGQMFFTTTLGAMQNANTLLMAPAPDLYDINVPFYNLNQLNQVPNGTIKFTVNLGSKLVLAPGFNLAASPLNTYFTWSQAIVGAGNVVITGTQIAAIPADFDGNIIFRVKGDSACKSNVVANVVITNQLQTLSDDDLQNNAATLQYTLPITLTRTQVNVTCNGAANGIINILASSGTTVVTTGPASYSNTQSLASGQNNLQLTGLVPGTYTITVNASSDAPLTSCSQSTTVTILQPTVLSISNTGHTNNSCFNASAATITVSATGGTAPYTYTISGPTVNTSGALSGVFTGLSAGSYTVTVTDNNGCASTTATIIITQPVGGVPDISLGSDVTGSLFSAPGVSQTIVYNIAEIAGNSAIGDTIRITKVAGFTINFNPTIFSTVVGSTTYTLDNPRWKIDNSNPAFVSIILTDPNNAANAGTLLCNQLVRVAVSITRNTTNISTYTLSARLRQANGEVNLSNNLNSIIFAAE